MILANITRAIREQNWFAVAVEFLIVIAGVVIGFQITAWNGARSEQERSRQYLSRIDAELRNDIRELQLRAQFWERVVEQGEIAIGYAETGELDGASEWDVLRSFLHASQSWQISFVDTTYMELRSAGELRLIDDADLRAGLAEYYVLTASRRAGDGPYSMLPKYREMVRGRMRSDIFGYYWSTCFDQDIGVQILSVCPPPADAQGLGEILEQLAADHEIVDNLRYWITEQAQAVQLVEFDTGRAEALIERIGAQN